MKFAHARIKKLNATFALSQKSIENVIKRKAFFKDSSKVYNENRMMRPVIFTTGAFLEPIKPAASNQKYHITAQGKRLITAKAD